MIDPVSAISVVLAYPSSLNAVEGANLLSLVLVSAIIPPLVDKRIDNQGGFAVRQGNHVLKFP